MAETRPRSAFAYFNNDTDGAAPRDAAAFAALLADRHVHVAA
jgi:uncharacterized protein YecE (DUF72 family)